MGTRGTIGFIINEQEKLTYNHYDSYPAGIGIRVLAFLREHTVEELRPLAEALKVVDDREPATPEQILELRGSTNWKVQQYSMAGPQPEDVSPDSPDGLPTEDVSWYNLLRETQGDLDAILRVGYMEDNHSFPLDSLFCEWAYVIDLDRSVLEVYQGFQKELPKSGRWKGRPTAKEDAQSHKEHLAWCRKNGREPYRPKVSEFKAVALIGTFPLGDELHPLPSDEEFVALLDPEVVDE